MRSKLLVLAVAALLALVLAVPASASKSVEISGEAWGYPLSPPVEVTRGNTCHVTSTNYMWWTGDIEGESIEEAHHMAKGPCKGGPGFWEESSRWEEYFTGTILGSEEGTIRMTCPVRMFLDPPRWEGSCALHSGTDGLTNVHGTFDWVCPLEGPCTYQGEVHLDPAQ